MHRFLLFFPFTLFLLTANGLQATVFPVGVEGGDEELRSNISAHLGEIDLGSVEQLPSHLPAMNKSIRSALEALGYYEGEWSIGTDRTGLNIKNRALLPGSRVIKVNVSPGKPVLIRKLDIRFSGSGEQQAEVVQLMRGLPLKERHRLRQRCVTDVDEHPEGVRQAEDRECRLSRRFDHDLMVAAGRSRVDGLDRQRAASRR